MYKTNRHDQNNAWQGEAGSPSMLKTARMYTKWSRVTRWVWQMGDSISCRDKGSDRQKWRTECVIGVKEDTRTLIKNKIKISLYIKKLRWERLQCQIGWRASKYMKNAANIQSYMRRPLVIYDFPTAAFWIFSYMRKILFSFLSVQERKDY